MVLLSLVFTPMLPVAAIMGMEAYAGYQMVETQGVIEESKVVRNNGGKIPISKQWLKNCKMAYGEPVHRQWLLVREYPNEVEAIVAADLGSTVSVWYDPIDPDNATCKKPEYVRNGLWTLWLTLPGSYGLVCFVALIQRFIRRGPGSRTAST